MPIKPNAYKYSPPQLPAVVRRQRLLEILHGGEDKPLTMVIGQAAQGKSTLVADYLKDYPAPDAWLHLDAGDAASTNFFQLLVHALSRALPDDHLHDYGDSAPIALGTSAGKRQFDTLLESLWQRIPAGTVIVLDGLEQIGETADALGMIRRMRHLAEDKGRIMITSRRMPPFKFQRGLMRRRVTILDNAQIAFTSREIRHYFENLQGYDLSIQGADSIHTVTGGWTGGLVLVSQALNRKPKAQWDDFIAHQLPASLTHETLGYFSEEVFDQQSGAVQDVLLHAAVLPVVDPGVLAHIFDDLDVSAVLDDLVRSNLFIQTVYDDHQRPLYRLNHLFRSFLRALFRKRFDARARRQRYVQLADVYRQNRQAEMAVGYYLRIEDFDAAADCIKKVGTDLVIRGRFNDLEEALTDLPEEMIAADPWLRFYLTLTRRIMGGVRNIADLTSVMQAFDKQRDLRGQLLSLAYLIEAQVFAGLDPAACLDWIAKAEMLLTDHGDTPHYAFARALLWLQIGFGHIVMGLDLTKGVSACQNAYLMAHRIGDARLMANANMVAALGMALAGDFTRADAALAKISRLALTDAYPEYNTLRGLVKVQLALHRGDLDEAGSQLEPIAKEIEKFGLLFLYPAFVEASGSLQIYRGDFDRARSTIRHLLDVASLAGNEYVAGLSHRLSALCHYFEGRDFEADQAVGRALAVFERGEQFTLPRMRTRQLAGIIAFHLKDLDRAAALLEQAQRDFSVSGHFLSQCECHLGLALLAEARKDPEAMHGCLARGFAMAAAYQYEHFVMLRLDDLQHCCQLAMDTLDKPETAWPEHLLHAKFGRPDWPAGPSPFPATGRGAEADAHPGDSRRLAIRTFGGFHVLRNGQTPIDDKSWGGNRTRLLLKAVIVHGCQDIPKDILIEDLWPERQSGAANQNFKVTLHRLRKILEPDLAKHQRSAYVHLKNGLVSLDRALCHVDVQEFLACCKNIKRALLGEETGTILQLGRTAELLYQGDFLPEEPYAPWAEMKRLALKGEFISILLQMADIHEARHQHEIAARYCRKLVAVDPCLERANHQLMRLLVHLGRRNDAVQVYEKMRRTLEKDLGVAPDPAITEFYQEIT